MAFWSVGPRSEKSSSISSSRILTRLIIPAFSTHEWASTHHTNWTGLSSSELEVCEFQREPPHWNKFVQNSLSTKRPSFAAANQWTPRVKQCTQQTNRSELNWTEVKWNEMNWSEVKWNEMNWTEPKWSEMKWTEVKWSEVKRNELNWTELEFANCTDVKTFLSLFLVTFLILWRFSFLNVLIIKLLVQI